jgi:hypothetical protein
MLKHVVFQLKFTCYPEIEVLLRMIAALLNRSLQ